MKNQEIEMKGVRVNNLKNIDLTLALNQLIVITGVSGSGKSSLAFDTLFAEGQRRYVESLSSYARQFLGRLNKPECDSISGIPPAIAIEQRTSGSNPRSTVGTSTEIYDYLKLLFARIGRTISPVSGEEVLHHTPQDVTAAIMKQTGDVVTIMAQPKALLSRSYALLSGQGFTRVKFSDQYYKLEALKHDDSAITDINACYLVIDHLTVTEEASCAERVAEAVESAFYEGEGICLTEIDSVMKSYSKRFELDGITFEVPTPNLFSFNSPMGACPFCEGFGSTVGIDEKLVVPNTTLSLFENAVMCWRGEKMQNYKLRFISQSEYLHFPIHTPYRDLTTKEKDTLWNHPEFGILAFFKMLEEKKYQIQNRVMIARYTGKTTCPHCKGGRLKPEATYVKVNDKSIVDLVEMPVGGLKTFFEHISLNEQEQEIAGRLLKEIRQRLDFLNNVGLDYLTLNRRTASLSGGELQRIKLSTSLASSLVGSLYILDEPSIGLHPRDSQRLINVMKALRDLGNTVVVVEHDEQIIRQADDIVDIGPLAGRLGGEVVFHGPIEALCKAKTLTADYLNKRIEIPIPKIRRNAPYQITLSAVTEHNLKNLTVHFPLNVITAVTGVSGSGKSTLVREVLYPELKRYLEGNPMAHASDETQVRLTGDLIRIKEVEFIDQNPIGRSTRSNPVTYLKAWDYVRQIFADERMAKRNGLTASHFTFNIPGGRCEECQGEGVIKVDMQFMADVYLQCEQCKGRRFKDEVLEVTHRGANIFDVLEMTVNQAITFFSEGNTRQEQAVVSKLQKLADVGLGYIRLGQSSSTLSGGESQRVKLAYHLSLENDRPTLFIFDEPTTGLHFHDINNLMKSLNALIDRGHTVLIIEHNMEVIKSADHIIDLGPEGGDKGGYLLFEGTPEALCEHSESYTGQYLKPVLSL